MKKQKKITQYDYERESKPFEKYVIKADEKMDADYAVIHLDGVGVTKNFFNKMTEEEQEIFFSCLIQAAKRLCERHHLMAKIAYACNDEISLLIYGNEYGNRIQKIVSIYAAEATLWLNQELRGIQCIEGALKDLQEHGCVFAAKCYNIPKRLIEKYFLWRQLSCKKSVFDKKLDFEQQKPWRKWGGLIVRNENGWTDKIINLTQFQIIKNAETSYFSIVKKK